MSRPVPAARDEAFRALCRRMGWRSTAQRRAVYRAVAGDRTHPDVESVRRRVCRRVPDVSLDTVYRILDELAGAGVVRRLANGRTLRYDGRTAPHHHFQCARCGRVDDFTCPDAAGVLATCRAFGHVEDADLFVYGVCRACGGAPSARAAGPGGGSSGKSSTGRGRGAPPSPFERTAP